MHLTDDQIEGLRKRYGKVGVIDFYSHQMVFRKPNRDDVRVYRHQQDSTSEKPDCLDNLAQVLIVAFDGNQDPIPARTLFNAFVEEYPLFMNSAKALAVINILTGIVEVEDAENLGKGVSVRSLPRQSTPTASPPGSVTA